MRISDLSSDVCSSDLPDRLDLAKLAGDEALPAKAGIDAHHQHQVDVFQYVIEHLGGRGGVERNARLLAQRLDALDGAVDMGTGLGMDGDDVGPRLGEGIEEIVDGDRESTRLNSSP